MAGNATRGSWTVDEAVVAHWKDAGLDDSFRNEWGDNQGDTTYHPLNHETADPEPPGPYATYVIGDPVRVANMSGKTKSEERQLLDYPVTFQVHAKSSSTATGKTRARDLAKLIASVFDPENEITICDDAWVQTRREGDQAMRLGDDEWTWILRFTIQVDAAYDR